VNFTREPIVETVITPKEGCKLVIRNSKGGGQEEFFVDAVEVVSFGNSLFFRSTERPKSFLVPVSDYEVLELKETRMVLKNVAHERSIKIGGGRENGARPKEQQPEAQKETAPKKREKRRTRRRKGAKGEPEKEKPVTKGEAQQEPILVEGEEEEKKELKKLFPPPPTLIKERLSSYKTAEIIAEDLIPKDLREMQKEEPELKKGKKPKEDEEEIPKPPAPPAPPEKGKKDIEDTDIVEKAPSKDEALANKEKE